MTPTRLAQVLCGGFGVYLCASGLVDLLGFAAVDVFAQSLVLDWSYAIPMAVRTAFGLLDHGGHLAVVGYTPEKVELRLSNLMALDATAAGNWGCPPEHYPEALALVLEGKVDLEPFVEERPLDMAPGVLAAAAGHELTRRVILVP